MEWNNQRVHYMTSTLSSYYQSWEAKLKGFDEDGEQINVPKIDPKDIHCKMGMPLTEEQFHNRTYNSQPHVIRPQ